MHRGHLRCDGDLRIDDITTRWYTVELRHRRNLDAAHVGQTWKLREFGAQSRVVTGAHVLDPLVTRQAIGDVFGCAGEELAAVAVTPTQVAERSQSGRGIHGTVSARHVNASCPQPRLR